MLLAAVDAAALHGPWRGYKRISAGPHRRALDMVVGDVHRLRTDNLHRRRHRSYGVYRMHRMYRAYRSHWLYRSDRLHWPFARDRPLSDASNLGLYRASWLAAVLGKMCAHHAVRHQA